MTGEMSAVIVPDTLAGAWATLHLFAGQKGSRQA